MNYVCNYFNVSLDYVFEFCEVLNYKNAVPTISKELQRERLKQLRNEYGLTQQELADSINVGKSTIGDYERMAKIIATPFFIWYMQKIQYICWLPLRINRWT